MPWRPYGGHTNDMIRQTYLAEWPFSILILNGLKIDVVAAMLLWFLDVKQTQKNNNQSQSNGDTSSNWES